MIKNENDLLGLLIKLKNENGDVRNEILPNEADLDPLSIEHLMQDLIKNRYIIYTFDTTTVTKLGEINYISPEEQRRLWFKEKLLLTTKEIIVFVAGVLSTLIGEIILSLING